MSTFATQLISVILGVFASLLAWSVLFHFLRPRLEFSAAISRIAADEEAGGFAYRIKLRNPSRRAVIDVTYTAKLRIRGLNAHAPQNWEITYLPVSFNGRIPVIGARRGKRIYHLVRIKADKPEEFTRSVYPSEIREKAAAGALTLEDVLRTGSEASVQILGFGSDAFSGARREFTSPEYTLESISPRRFKQQSLDLVDPEPAAEVPVAMSPA